jgi:hypothetical protein
MQFIRKSLLSSPIAHALKEKELPGENAGAGSPKMVGMWKIFPSWSHLAGKYR